MAEPESVAALFGSAVADALSHVDERARLVAELEVAGEVIRHLADYVPVNMPHLPADVGSFGRMEISEIRAALGDPKLAFTFGTYRAEVTEREGQNAARLGVLVSTLHSLIRARTLKPAEADRAIETIDNWIHRVWRVEAPLAGDVRAWARKQTWRMDVLPSAWRHL